MCGISGFLGFDGLTSDSSSILRAMTDSITHRGPDSDGYWIDPNSQVALGHRRLSIIDLSAAGAQPMRSASGNWVVVFNGEIYNHLELRDELLSAGRAPAWRGHSDTETLLACFEQWGVEATLRRLVGMFAMAVWSVPERKLILARDRFGEKPLYFGWLGSSGTTLVFGSELRVLERHPLFEAKVDRQALARFMRHLCVSGIGSIATGVDKVPPGSMLVFALDRPRQYQSLKYWSLASVGESAEQVSRVSASADAEMLATLDSMLRRSIRGQMLSDVPLGAFLSGGIDSSLIVAIMQRLSDRPVRTFSIGFSEEGYNEAGFAKEVAKSLGTDHTELYVSAETARKVIPELPHIYDEPFADSSQIPTVLVSRLARQHVTVALSGDAGDEVFGGYNRYLLSHRYWPYLRRIPASLRRVAGRAVLSLAPDELERLGRAAGLNRRWAGVASKLQKTARVIGAESLSDLYQKLTTTWEEAVVLGANGLHQNATYELSGDDRDVSWMMRADLAHYLPSDILVKVDRAAMSTSLETRVPFLDHRLVEWAAALPLHYKIRSEQSGYQTKWLLRQALYQYVPRSLIERPKMGFGIPLADWLRGPLKSWADDLLDVSSLRNDGFLDAELVSRRWSEHRSGARDWEHHLWCVLMFQSWLQSKSGRRYS